MENMSMALNAAICESAIVGIMVDYAKFLLKNGKVDSREQAITKVSEIISASMDRGECSTATLEKVKVILEQCPVKTNHMECRCHFDHVLEKILVKGVGGGNVFGFTEAEQDEFKMAAEAVAAAKAKCDALVAKYKADLAAIVINYVNQYEKAFDADFVKCYTEATI